MSNTLKPIVGVGTKLPQGTVVSISNDGVVVEKKGKKSTVGFKQVEQTIAKESLMFPQSLLSLRKGDKVSCKYPKHGRRNILKRHTGTVEKVSSGANGLYATVRAEAGQVRNLSYSKIIDPQVS